jgi:hypothetical protein
MYSRLPRPTDQALVPAPGVLILTGCSGSTEAASGPSNARSFTLTRLPVGPGEPVSVTFAADTKVTFEIETLESDKLIGKLIGS